MATAITGADARSVISSFTPAKTGATKGRGQVAEFFVDLFEDLRHNPFDSATPKSDLFRNHINALAISYFALIVLLIAASIPVLAWMIEY
jgi:hypothetical protein